MRAATRDARLGPFVNLFTNPRLVGDGTWAEVRRNYCPVPFGSQSLSGWIGNTASVSRTSTGDGIRVEITNPISANQQLLSRSNTEWQVSPGEAVSAYWRVYRGAGFGSVSVTPQIHWRGASGEFIATHNGTPITLEDAGDWYVISVEGAVAPEGTVYARPTVSNTHSWPVGQAIVVADGSTFEKATHVIGAIAPGLPSPDPDMRVSWLGEPNASEPVMEIERVRGVAGAYGVAGVSTWGGKPAARLIPTSTSAHPSMRFEIPESARSRGTILGSLHFESPGQAVSSFVRKIQASVQPHEETDMVPNIPGSYDLRLFIQDRPSGSEAVWYGNGTAGSGYGDVWWTDIGLFEGEYNGPYFDGDSPRCAWLGVPHQSPSAGYPPLS